ncbi:hypothetical protein HC891_07400 [Candidatus Gracilibacteria bacterium]|nr:hypothetical protein [Candidatus Gracilibacteria bacterium]
MGKTPFRPDQNGFAFINRWHFQAEESAEIRQSMLRPATEQGLRLAKPQQNSMFGLNSLFQSGIDAQVKSWLNTQVPDGYGLCGGMAFAAADHFIAGKPLPRGLHENDHPTNDTPYGKALRSYLWDRQRDSLAGNASTLLGWMAMLHFDIAGLGGADWLLERTREEFAELKRYIDSGKPWPICLVGTSMSPFDNHQVLCYGYDDNGDGTSMIYLYDMNCPGREHITRLDMRGKQLEAQESCPGPHRGPLRAFFCNNYTPEPPPALRA